MKTDLTTILNQFLLKHNPMNQSFLIGFSGGPDSSSLFHAALKLREKKKLHFAVAHVNHQWREESHFEAKMLEKLAHDHQISFHLKVLHPELLEGNLENASRIERQHFFLELCQKKDYAAVMLGHQADDQAETTLKRILEGAGVLTLKGLQEVTSIDHLVLWRPFLKVTKKEILAWLIDHGISWLEDKTNQDVKFLRGRFRKEIIPSLEESFGKNISRNLSLLSSEMAELNEFVEGKINRYLENVKRGPLGMYLDLSSLTAPFLLKAVLKKVSGLSSVFLSREQLDLAAKSLLSKKTVQITGGNEKVFVDRGILFILKPCLPDLPILQPVKLGESQYGPWIVNIINAVEGKKIKTEWQALWEGRAIFQVKEENSFLAPSSFNLKTAVKGDKVMQDFESESFVMGADHSQKVKAAPITNDYGSKDCVNLSSSTAVFRFNPHDQSISKHPYERIPPFLRPYIPVIWHSKAKQEFRTPDASRT